MLREGRISKHFASGRRGYSLAIFLQCNYTSTAPLIPLHGEPVAVVISTVMFEQLTGSEQSLVDFMRRSPLYGDEDIPL